MIWHVVIPSIIGVGAGIGTLIAVHWNEHKERGDDGKECSCHLSPGL